VVDALSHKSSLCHLHPTWVEVAELKLGEGKAATARTRLEQAAALLAYPPAQGDLAREHERLGKRVRLRLKTLPR
jgi:hypothetical protein